MQPAAMRPTRQHYLFLGLESETCISHAVLRLSLYHGEAVWAAVEYEVSLLLLSAPLQAQGSRHHCCSYSHCWREPLRGNHHQVTLATATRDRSSQPVAGGRCQGLGLCTGRRFHFRLHRAEKCPDEPLLQTQLQQNVAV